ncbi:hypothetical protein BKA61DRAFT_616512, partial [Leptodontidium sp. MPI-SDFR-AT-0119]
MGIKCLQQHQQDGSTFISTQTAQVSTSITPETPANDGDKIYSDFKSGYHTDLEGGRWPIVETASDLSFDDWIPCDTCLVNERACDNDGPPCRSCILHGVRSSCSSAIAEDQSYQAQPLVMEYDPAQLRLVPDTEVSTNAWDRINSMLEAGTPSVPSNYISPYPPIPQPAPMAPVNWDEIDEQLGFSSTVALGNASAEMEAQSSNWASKEDRVWSGGAQYNTFRQELDMHGNILPGGRISNEVVDQALENLFSSVGNGYASLNPSTVNTETNQVATNNSSHTDEEMGISLLAYINDQADTSMGGTN